jgi:hypothetical protein
MMRYVALVMLVLLLAVCGKQEEVEKQDPSTSLQGRWTGEQSSEVDGDKIVEILSIFFYKSMGYKWTYTISVKGVQDDDRSFVEDGTFVATETEIIFTAEDGSVKTYTYELTGRSDIVMIMSDDSGFIWYFTDFWKSRYMPY